MRFSMPDPAQAKTVNDAMLQGYEVEKCVYDQSGNTMVVTYPTKEKLVAEVEELGYDPAIVESAGEIDLNSMLAFQAMYQAEWADNAVSFTVNFPEGKYEVHEATKIIESWLPDLKGTTLMPDGTRPQSPVERITEEEFNSYTLTSIEDSTDENRASGACPIR
ncbi:hypothetical protein [Streptomyces sp. NPDC057582]|uniref:hypothetical protein n=1 Tax=Streptomyces sp. NPDC057582 TaxID=3346174 RepID=UPI00367DEAA6